MNLINNKKIKNTIFLLFVSSALFGESNFDIIKKDGKKVFKTYCWGCHHQTSMAFGPSFKEIANKRTKQEIMAYIISPISIYKQQGYKRSVMPSFIDELSTKELESITQYILLYKDKK